MLSNKHIVTIIFLFCLQSIWAQNIILNHDFSNIQQLAPPPVCISYGSAFRPYSIRRIANWYSPVDTFASNPVVNFSNYSHNCQSPWISTPTDAKPNSYPFPPVVEGQAFAHISPKKTPFVFGRTSVTQRLGTALNSGEKYTIEFYTRPFIWTTYLTKNIGAYLTPDSLQYFDFLSDLTPTIESSNIITDTTQWIRITGFFVASGNEQFITIGNFRHDSSSTFLLSNFPIDPSYGLKDVLRTDYFIDAVYLYKATDTVYSVTLPQDTLLCPNETLNLVAQLDSGFKLQDTVTTYLWNNGSTDSTLLVTAPGTYWVQTNINHRFVQSDTIVVSYFADNYTLDLPDSVAICENDLANISAATIPQTQYFWDNGHTGQTLYDVGTGTYALEAVTPCYTLYDTVKVYQQFCDTYIYIPNSFTPDGDGTNDYFEFTGVPEPVTLLVYDRWGGLVFKDTAYQNTWNGTSGGQPLPAGAYNYVIEYLYVSPKATSATEGSSKSLTGTVRILR